MLLCSIQLCAVTEDHANQIIDRVPAGQGTNDAHVMQVGYGFHSVAGSLYVVEAMLLFSYFS